MYDLVILLISKQIVFTYICQPRLIAGDVAGTCSDGTNPGLLAAKIYCCFCDFERMTLTASMRGRVLTSEPTACFIHSSGVRRPRV